MSGSSSPSAPLRAPQATVLVPARNEAADLGRCLAAIAAQDLDLDRIEVIVVDGGSVDGTGDVAEAALAGAGFHSWQVIVNPEATTPSNLNVGLAAAGGAVLCRVDARSIVPPDYVRRCTEILAADPSVVVVGGAQVALAADRNPTGLGVARALNNKWGMGLSRYRRGAPSGPADTVYLGSFRTDDLRAAGGWNTEFTTNQDFELNRRMGTRGTVWFEAGLDVGYVPRRRLVDLWRQYHRFGRWKAAYWTSTGDAPRPRQLVIVVAPVLAGGLGVLALRQRPLRVPLLVVGAMGAVAFEATGPSGPAGADVGVTARAMSLVASATVAGGWLSGVWAGLARWSVRRSTHG